eukprot:TRINITY_DN8325_c0_g1_i1.p1 TRINITY_DN8325_c0_g1~~TRINITY_DN8325_c0_g1_i1.p1  ORF type:complete len:376 (+),score=100.01 TRINITY_DN8325_c0_g1_i1:91-1218(+)
MEPFEEEADGGMFSDEPLDADGHVYEFEVESGVGAGQRTERWRWRRCVPQSRKGRVVAGAAALVLVAAVGSTIALALLFFAPSSAHAEPYPRVYSSHDPSDVQPTIEYQVTLDESECVDRLSVVAAVQEMYDPAVFDLPRDLNGTAPEYGDPLRGSWETVRKQYTIHKHGCRGPVQYSVRVREYVWGGRRGSMTVDAKTAELTRSKAIELPMWPSRQHGDAFQKIEVDKHGCGSKATKFGRETRMYGRSEDPLPMSTCYDLYRLYPDAVYYHKKMGDELTPNDPDHFWLYEQFGTMQCGGKTYRIQTAISQGYEAEADAIAGGVLPVHNFSEWSLRVWAEDDSDDECLAAETLRIRSAVANAFGTYPEKKCYPVQ